MDPYTRFTKCMFIWNRSLLQFMGHDLINADFRQNFHTYLVYAYIGLVTWMNFYNFLYYDGITKLFAWICILMTLQNTIRAYNSRYAEDINWTVCLIQDLYKIHVKTKSRNRAKYFEKFAHFTETLFKSMIFSFVFCFFICLSYSIYMYFIEGELIPMIPLYLPINYLNGTTLIGFVLLNLFQLIFCVIGCILMGALEFLMVIIIVSSLIFAMLISSDLKQVNADLQDDECGMLEVKARFINIFLMHQQMAEYMRRIDKITFKMFFVQVGTSTIGSIITLYGILTINYLPYYCMMFLLLIQIIIACVLGNCIQLAHDRIYDSALELNWNELDVQGRFFYKFFIHRCQTPKLLTIGGLIPLNLNSCVKIFARIYSITAVIYTAVHDN